MVVTKSAGLLEPHWSGSSQMCSCMPQSVGGAGVGGVETGAVGPVGPAGGGGVGAGAHSAVHSPRIVKATVLLMLVSRFASPQTELQAVKVELETG